jgi:Zn-dependent metalloprotease
MLQLAAFPALLLALLPNFDIRETTPTTASQKAAIKQREAAIATYVKQNAGTRATTSPSGLPKMVTRDLAPLSTASAKKPESIARDFLARAKAIVPLSTTERNQLKLIVNDAKPGAPAYLTFNQTLSGILVQGGQIKITLSAKGEVVQLSAGEVIPGLKLSTKPAVAKAAAEKAALASLGDGPPAKLAGTTELIILPTDVSNGKLVYRINVQRPGEGYELFIDAHNAKVLVRHQTTIRN